MKPAKSEGKIGLGIKAPRTYLESLSAIIFLTTALPKDSYLPRERRFQHHMKDDYSTA